MTLSLLRVEATNALRREPYSEMTLMMKPGRDALGATVASRALAISCRLSAPQGAPSSSKSRRAAGGDRPRRVHSSNQSPWLSQCPDIGPALAADASGGSASRSSAGAGTSSWLLLRRRESGNERPRAALDPAPCALVVPCGVPSLAEPTALPTALLQDDAGRDGSEGVREAERASSRARDAGRGRGAKPRSASRGESPPGAWHCIQRGCAPRAGRSSGLRR
mmetsp:Transcript_74154/g.193461  ORF Transcript_74154/g.193461 Transcript_74154/m.193461 type:complete len:222 (+) Transcript_74154:148-813(+)